MEDGYTKEEWKMMMETKKILDPKIKLTATLRAGCRCSSATPKRSPSNSRIRFPPDEARDILRNAPGWPGDRQARTGGYVTPYEAAGEDATYISRIRADPTVDNGLAPVVGGVYGDNLRKGAALKRDPVSPNA